jgi:hypothetical protein
MGVLGYCGDFVWKIPRNVANQISTGHLGTPSKISSKPGSNSLFGLILWFVGSLVHLILVFINLFFNLPLQSHGV